MHRMRLTACSAVAAGAASAVLALAVPAQAHVTIDPGEAEQGAYRTINIKVPNERDNASTTRLEVHLDPGHPLSSVMPQPVPGWEVEVETTQLDEPLEVHGSEITEVPATLTWTGGEIEPGTFQQFPVSVGPLPEDTDRLVFDAIQTYDSGEVVRWIEEPVEGGAEPEHPSPVLRLVPAGETTGTGSATGTDTEADGAAETETGGEGTGETAADDGDATDTTARVLGGLGIAVGAAGIAFGVLASRRRTTSTTTPSA